MTTQEIHLPETEDRFQGFYSVSQVSRLARIPRGTLHSWKTRGIFQPSVQILVNGEVVDEGYSYADLTIVRLSRAIRDKKLNMRSVCIALRHLIERFGSPDTGWQGVHVYIANNHVYAERPDQWEVTAADKGGQKVEPKMFDDVFDILRNMDEGGDVLIPSGYSESITIDPNVMGGVPVVRNTRIPTTILAAKYHKGATIDRLVELYEPVSRESIERAIEYEEFLNSPIA